MHLTNPTEHIFTPTFTCPRKCYECSMFQNPVIFESILQLLTNESMKIVSVMN